MIVGDSRSSVTVTGTEGTDSKYPLKSKVVAVKVRSVSTGSPTLLTLTVHCPALSVSTTGYSTDPEL